jgi:hypothetical protein
VITEQSVLNDRPPETPPKSHHVALLEGLRYVDAGFTLVIDKQEGFRFSGVKSSDRRREIVSGVIGFENNTVYMAEEDGILLCRLVAPDKMEYVYLHVTTQRSIAGRGFMTLKR